VKQNFNKKYYSKFCRNNETLPETIIRIDNKVVDDRFKRICDRDILSSGMIINKEQKVDGACKSCQKSKSYKSDAGVKYVVFSRHAEYLY